MLHVSREAIVCFCYLLPDSLLPTIPSRGLSVSCLIIYILDSILYSPLLQFKYISVVISKPNIFKAIHRRLIVLETFTP
jgi:hypothetical protein